MSDLVRVRLNGVEKNVGRGFAAAKGLEVLDEPTHRRDGTLRAATRKNGRRMKKKTSVSVEAAKKAAASAAPEKADSSATTAEEA